MESNTCGAAIAMIADNMKSVAEINNLLHDYSRFILGRMGVPHCEKGLSVINVVLDAPADIISTLTGKLERIDGVSANTVCSD